jgi:hypothetical protein
MIIQPNLYIPPEIEAGLINGGLFRNGGVIRDHSTGSIVRHLEEVPGPVNSQEAVGRVAVNLKRPGVIITVAALSVVALGATALIAARRQKQTDKPEVPECVENYNASLRAYLEAVREGSLDADIISQLIFDLDAVKAYSVNGSIAIYFSTKQSGTLVNLVVDYTRKLAEANSVELNELQGQAPTSGSDVVVDLRRYLEVQRKIFTRAA